MDPGSSLSLQVRSILRMSPRTVLIASILVFLISSKFIAARFAGYFIITEVLAAITKKLLGGLGDRVRRPDNAGNCMGCGTFFKCDKECVNSSNQIGMPSGHSLTMAMSATFWSWWIWRNGSGSKISKFVNSSLLALLALIVIFSRTIFVENCHTMFQVTVGTLFGAALGTGFYFLEMFVQEKFPNTIGKKSL